MNSNIIRDEDTKKEIRLYMSESLTTLKEGKRSTVRTKTSIRWNLSERNPRKKELRGGKPTGFTPIWKTIAARLQNTIRITPASNELFTTQRNCTVPTLSILENAEEVPHVAA